jgi:phage FluMu protein Com|tara:strand:- start:5 stop:721 length:717 start_codon:yes stop_codon:yes gene_type:complete
MGLPTLISPHFDTELPSGMVIKMRSMVMSEYKILMIAKESPENMSNAIIQVLGNCIIGESDVGLMSLVDIEYLFIKLHASSTAKQAFQLKSKCPKCKTDNKVGVDLNQIRSSNPDFKDKTFKFPNNITITVSTPKFKDFIDLAGPVNASKDSMDVTLKLIASSISMVTNNDMVMKAGVDFTIDQAVTMLESLSISEITDISKHTNSMPRIELSTGYVCKCGHKEPILIQGITDFFAYL